MPANVQRPRPMGALRLDLQADAHLFFDTLFSGCRVLDVGAGLGVSKTRIRHNRVTTHDIDPRLPVDVVSPEPPLGPFDIVTAFDVLEHVEDDVAFARTLDVRATRALFFTTPNWYVHRGESTHHWREYTPREMVEFACSIWPEEQIRLFGFFKDGLGGWFDPIPRDVWMVHAGLKHGLLILKHEEDRVRIDLAYPAVERWVHVRGVLRELP